MKILIVDDEDLIRKALQRFFLKKNYSVDTAENGVIALDLILKNKYDFVVLDLLMPEKNGFDVLKEMNQNIPVVIISAFTGGVTDSFHSEEFPLVIGFIKKPFNHIESTISEIERMYENYIRKV